MSIFITLVIAALSLLQSTIASAYNCDSDCSEEVCSLGFCTVVENPICHAGRAFNCAIDWLQNLRATKHSLQVQADAAAEELDNAKADLAAVKVDQASIEGKLKAGRETLSTVSTDIATASSSSKSVITDIEAVKIDIKAADATISTLDHTLSQAKESLDAATDVLDAAQGKLKEKADELAKKTEFITVTTATVLNPLIATKGQLLDPVTQASKHVKDIATSILEPTKNIMKEASSIIQTNNVIIPEFKDAIISITDIMPGIENQLSLSIDFKDANVFNELDFSQSNYLSAMDSLESATRAFKEKISNPLDIIPVPDEFKELAAIYLDPKRVYESSVDELGKLQNQLESTNLVAAISPDYVKWLINKSEIFQDWIGEKSPVVMKWFAERDELFRNWLATREAGFRDWLVSKEENFRNWLAVRDEGFRDWFALQDRRFQDWLAERDDVMRDYLASRDKGFRDWLAKNGVWSEEAQRQAGVYADLAKDGETTLSIEWKENGKTLSEGTKAMVSELKYIIETCGNIKSVWESYALNMGGIRYDIGQIKGGDWITVLTVPSARALFSDLALGAAKYATRCVSSALVPVPKYIDAKGAKLSSITIAKLVLQIIKMEKNLNKDVLTTEVKPAEFEIPTNPNDKPKIISPESFPGVCGGMIRESGPLGFYGLNSVDWQNGAKDYIGRHYGTDSINGGDKLLENCNSGDGIVFTSLAYYSEPTQQFQTAIRDSFGPYGHPFRSALFKQVWNQYGHYTGAFSKDMATGLNFYFLASKDTGLARKFKEYLLRTSGLICDILLPPEPSIYPRHGEKKEWKDQFGTCLLTPPSQNMLARVFRKIGVNSGNENPIQFYLDQDIIRQALGISSTIFPWLPPSIVEMRAALSSDDLDFKAFQNGTSLFLLKTFEYEYHLKMLDILTFAELGMLTAELAEAAAVGSRRWHEEAARVDHRVENLFYQYLANYTGAGDQVEFGKIAEKLLVKMDCWEDPLNADRSLKSCWKTDLDPVNLINGREGWSFQRSPLAIDKDTSEETRMFHSQVSNPFGPDLIFLGKLLIGSKKMQIARSFLRENPRISESQLSLLLEDAP